MYFNLLQDNAAHMGYVSPRHYVWLIDPFQNWGSEISVVSSRKFRREQDDLAIMRKDNEGWLACNAMYLYGIGESFIQLKSMIE